MKQALLLLCATVAFGQAPPPPPPAAPAATPTASADSDPVVLTVGTQKFTRSQFETILAGLPEQQRASAMTPDGKKKIAQQLAEILTLAQEAKARKLDQDPKVQLQLVLSTSQMLANTMYRDFGENGHPDAAALKAYYDEHKSEWEEVKARHILIRFEGSRVPVRPEQKDLTDAQALAKAQDLKKKIDGGADFATLAKAESDDVGSGAEGGDLGPFTKDRMVPEFSAVAFSLAPGKVSDPVKTQFGYHIIKVESHSTKSFDDVKGEIENRIKPDIARKSLDDLKKKNPALYDDGYFGK